MNPLRIVLLFLMFALGFLINHAVDAYSRGAAGMIVLGAILGGAIVGLSVMSVLDERKPWTDDTTA